MSDLLTTPIPLQLRAELDKLVRQDLLGPAGGERETGGFTDLLTPLTVAYAAWLTRQEGKMAGSGDLDSYQTEV